MSVKVEFIDRYTIRNVIEKCRSQLNPSHNRTALVLEHLGLGKVYFASTKKMVRVDVADPRAFMLARIRYGF